MRLSRRQGLQLMLGAAQAVFVGAAGCALTGYAATVAGRSGGAPLAHWRCSDSQDLFDEQPGARHGAYTGSPSLVSGLPADSDQALSFPGDVHGEVADDAGLHLASFSVSGWLKVDGTPTAKIAVWSKDASGLNDGDFAVTINEELTLGAQFQSASAQHELTTDIDHQAVYHWAVVAGDFGFDFFLDGKHVGRNTSFTAGWTNNDKAIQFAKAPWTTEEFVGVIDEVSLYDYELTDADVIALSQVTSAPVAAEPSLVVTENGTVAFDPFASSECVGRKANLVVELWNGSTWGSSVTTTHGSATVNGNNDIEFTADEVTQNETDSFDYRITDAKGTSAAATVSLQVNDSADGGTLVWEWQISEAQAQSWIDGVSLANRDYDDVLGGDVWYPDTGGQPSPNRWVDATTVLNTSEGASGPTIWKRSNNAASHYRKMCWNRAPDGTPALEMASSEGHNGVTDFWLELFNPSDGNGPKHLRVVLEVKTCKSSDPTTYKGDGVGTTSGSYPDFQESHDTAFGATDHAALKYICQLTQGPIPRGSALTSYWNGNNNREINGIGHMMQTGTSSKQLKIYSPAWDRPNAGGVLSDQIVTDSGLSLDEPGMQGYWHKLEIEVKLTTPALVPTDDSGTRNTTFVRPSGGDGETWVYATPDIDGELGSPGQRQLVQYAAGQIMSPSQDEIGSDDNMHTLLNLTGPWGNWYYGGVDPAQAEVWAWIRKIQVYRHD